MIEDEIKFLMKQRALYYSNGTSQISDDEYDKRHDDIIKRLPTDHWFVKMVGHVNEDSPWQKANHLIPLGSLSKVNIGDEYEEWCTKVRKLIGDSDLKILIQEKLDGISIDLVYENGYLIKAITRGDGIKGEDIFRNVVKMQFVPLTIDKKERVSVRGEILLRHSIFHKLKKIDDTGLKNPRNAAAGMAKRLDGTKSECLSVITYDVLNMKECRFQNEVQAIQWLKHNKFEVVRSFFGPIDKAHKVYQHYIDTQREAIDWDIDGLVIKTDTYIDPGENWGHPLNKIAWKFPHQRTSTTVIGIEASARGGRITPVGLLEPVDCAGVTIRRASLSNWPNVIAMGIGVGAKVEISRRNDVIPYIESVLVKGDPPIIPSACPICKGDVEYEKNISGDTLVYLICTNENCPSKLTRKITKWMNAHETKGIGGSLIESLVDGNHVTCLIDFLNIPYNPDLQRVMRTMDGMGASKIKKLNEQIENSCITTVDKFLVGLDIKGMGKGSVEKIINSYGGNPTIEKIIDWIYQLRYLDSFGDDTLQSYREQLDVLKPTIDRLINIVKFENADDGLPGGTQLRGFTFCFTGNLSTIQRKDAEKFVKAYGGKVGAVNKALTHLVCNDKTSNTGKAKAVRQLWADGIPIKWIDEKEFLEMIGLDNKIDEVKMPEDKPAKQKKVKKVEPTKQIDSDIGDL